MSRTSAREEVALLTLGGRRDIVLVAGLTLALLLPFAAKAFHIDDPLFLWAARQIHESPLDPYGFEVNWRGTALPMAEITKNPPLASYYLALAASLAGWSETALHLAFLVPALGASLGTFLLASRLSREPLVATLAALLAPACLVSATTVMCDVTMLALWVWAVYLWVDGLERGGRSRLYGAAGLAAAAFLTKYFAISLVPLLAAYALARRERVQRWAWPLLVPVLTAAGYAAWARAMYGRVLPLDAVTYSVVRGAEAGGPLWLRGLVGLAFAGGCLLPAAALAPLGLRRGSVALALALGAAAGAFAGLATSPAGRFPLEVSQAGPVGVHFGIFVACGLLVLLLGLSEASRRRDPESLLLVLWLLGTFLFASFLNWTINARSLLPMAPAAGILVSRRLRSAGAPIRARRRTIAVAALAASGLVALGVAWGDFRLANAGKEAAETLGARIEKGTVWFQGHWGFQYYMEAVGARPWDFRKSRMRAGDLMIAPENTTMSFPVSLDVVERSERVVIPLGVFFTTLSTERGAGFYAHLLGPLPFRATRVPDERYFLFHLKAPETRADPAASGR